MKRRTFIQSLLALVAAPVVAKIPVEEVKPKLPDGFKVYKGHLPKYLENVWDKEDGWEIVDKEVLNVGDLVVRNDAGYYIKSNGTNGEIVGVWTGQYVAPGIRTWYGLDRLIGGV